MKKILVVAAVLLAGGFATLWFAYIGPEKTHEEWYHRIHDDIYALGLKRPPDASRDQWLFVVGWTSNLHNNCGAARSWVDPKWPDEFERELNRRLTGTITLEDINWIWAEYAAHTRHGPSYAEHYHPLHPENYAQAADVGMLGFHIPVK